MDRAARKVEDLVPAEALAAQTLALLFQRGMLYYNGMEHGGLQMRVSKESDKDWGCNKK